MFFNAIKSVLLCSTKCLFPEIIMKIFIKRQFSFFLPFFTWSVVVLAQNVPIGGWEEHMSYKKGLSVAEGFDKVFCATENGIFVYKKLDNSIERISKVNGLSDAEAAVLNYNRYNDKLIIAYKNSNIDIIDKFNNVVNISDIKRKTIVGNKAINNIYFINQYAYLACGFGIVVIDMDRFEVKDTYYIGTAGSYVNVRDITSDASYIYAATNTGVSRAPLNGNLSDFTTWSQMAGLPVGIYNTITSFNGKIFTNFSKHTMTNQVTYDQDTVFEYNGTNWSNHFSGAVFAVRQLRSSVNQLYLSMIQLWSVSIFDVSFNYHGYCDWYFGDVASGRSAITDDGGVTWIADYNHGLVKRDWGNVMTEILPNGPETSLIPNMASANGTLLIAPGGISVAWGNQYKTGHVDKYDGSSWKPIKGNYSGIINLDTIFDIMNVAFDPKKSDHYYAATWGRGVIEYLNDVPVMQYNSTNSTLKNFFGTMCLTYGMAFDKSNNLWITNSYVDSTVAIKKTNGTWQSLNFSPVIGNIAVGQIVIDKNDQKWIVLPRGNGLMVYKGNTTNQPNSSNTKKLSTSSGNGGLPTLGVNCLAIDKDEEIWVGTDKGICVFYSPEKVFTGQNFDAQQILIEQDGHVQILLETENITAIAVDGSNRKWIGTTKSGIYLMSADGTKTIYHFDENNSPLLSNEITSIAIDEKTGQVYIATAKGLISFRGTSLEPFENFSGAYVFPNPVKHDYSGPIAIKGLMANSTIKITDISGTLVYETKSEGGLAIWDGKTFDGRRVSSGVYMVFGTNEDGSQKMVTKILFIN